MSAISPRYLPVIRVFSNLRLIYRLLVTGYLWRIVYWEGSEEECTAAGHCGTRQKHEKGVTSA